MKKTKGLRRDHVKEACRRLGVVLKSSRKLGVKEADLGSLPAVAKLCAEPTRRGAWTLTILGLLVFTVFFIAFCTDLPSSFSCPGNSSSAATGMIHTVRKIQVDVADKSDSADDSGAWMTSQFQLRRDR
ncbi:hypothetical protein LSTR_LSTR000257 [Laodelphax striatellus]|uniref:Uncharacterized protein n=1 Tax=Laodelphax striatellus TaxID=195883 RepID=A0A482X755_LAOST|nr:hypothetical protein LSTR_LSTR000257 [Laodelphax striatellus]